MKIIEGLKKLNLLDKKMKHNCNAIEKYASQVSSEKPIFESEKEQKNQVRQLIQANKDLFEEYLSLKDKIDKTNATVEITIGDETRTINQFLNIHRKMGKNLTDTFTSLNDNNGYSKLLKYKDENIHIIRHYDEKSKNNNLRYWQDLIGDISGKLEVVNATTDIIED